MSIPPHIQKKSDRRICLWNKNKFIGLTHDEIDEYEGLTNSINIYIRKTWPNSMEKVKSFCDKNKITFNLIDTKIVKNSKCINIKKMM